MSTFPVKDANLQNVQIGSFWVPTIVTGSFTPQTAYANSGLCIGGLQNATLGLASIPFQLQLISLSILGLTAGQGVECFVFDSDPTGSTFTDDAQAVLVNGDMPHLVAHMYASGQPNYYGTNLPMSFDFAPRRMLVSDGTGKMWFAFVVSSLTNISSPHASWRVEVRN